MPLVSFLAFLLIILVIFDYLPKPQSRQTTQSQEAKSSGFGEKETQAKKDFTKLTDSYNQVLSDTQAEFGITYLDLETGEKASINGEKVFHAASTTKPIVAVYALKQVDEGKLSLEQKIGELPLSERIRLLVNISDNDSWEQLLKFFGISKIQNFSQSLGLLNTNHFKNTTTSGDLANFLVKIHRQPILSSKNKEFLLSLMQKTETEGRIPAGIANWKLVYHKAGSFNGEVHDIAIVNHPKNPFILAILSDGVNDLTGRPKILAQIARISWEFANKQ